MSRDKYLLINKFFHVANNSNGNLSDPIKKVRFLIDHFDKDGKTPISQVIIN